jgi:hypothetical protein
MLAGMLEINALLMWRRFKPEEELCDGILFRRGMAYKLMSNPVRITEKKESLALSRFRRLGNPGAPEHCLAKNPFGGRDFLKRLHSRYCDRESAYSCACSPWAGGDMNPRDAMLICIDRKSDRCKSPWHLLGSCPQQPKVNKRRGKRFSYDNSGSAIS